MIAKIINKLVNNEEKKLLFNNIFSLIVLQGSNYLLPLLTTPYLVRVLGPAYFGMLAFATASISYFMIITDYGFNLSATRQIAINRTNSEKISEIFSSVMMVKVILMFFSFFVMAIIVFSFNRFHSHWELYFLTFGMVVGQVMFPVWLFQGMERMKYIAYLNIAAKCIFTASIFVFVQKTSDYILVPLLTSMGFLIAGLVALYLVKKEFGVTFTLPSLFQVKFQFVEGWHIFLANIGKSSYQSSIIVFLGLFSSDIVVGFYSAADKLIQAVKGILQPIIQALYPLISKKFSENFSVGFSFTKRVSVFLIVLSLGLSTSLYYFSDIAVRFLFGDEFKETAKLIKIMSCIPILVAISAITCNLIMLNVGMKKQYMFVYLVTSLVSVIAGFLMTIKFEAYGAALTMLLAEAIVVFMSLFFLLKKRHFYNEKS